MADIADSAPTPQNPSDMPPGEYRTVQAILGRENYVNGLHYTSVEVRNRPGNVFQEPIDESVEESQSSAKDKNTFFSERDRLKTYEKWTDSYNVNPQDLAKNGFIHTGPGDKVMCVFCYNTITEWESGDNVQEEHARLYPGCPFVQGLCGGINKPILRQRNLRQDMNVRLNELLPCVPAFVDEVTRLETFEYWPSTNNQDPKTLAAAGFFYRPQPGKPDRVRCFMCGKHLHKWEPNDDPWMEHTRISPHCKFVLEIKGQDFLDRCRATKEKQKSAKLEDVGIPPPQSQSLPSNSKLSGSHLMEDPSKNTAVQAVLQDCGTDFSEEEVIKVFQRLSFLKGKDDNITAKQLLEKLYEEGEEG